MKLLYVFRISVLPSLPQKYKEFFCKALFITPDNKEEYDFEKGINNNVCLTTPIKRQFERKGEIDK